MRERLGKEKGSDRNRGALGLLDVQNQRNQRNTITDARDGAAQPQPEKDSIPKKDVAAGRYYATASSARSSALSMIAKPSASSSSLMQSGGLVMIVCQRTKV